LFEHAKELLNLMGNDVVMEGYRKMTCCFQTFGGHCILVCYVYSLTKEEKVLMTLGIVCTTYKHLLFYRVSQEATVDLNMWNISTEISSDKSL